MLMVQPSTPKEYEWSFFDISVSLKYLHALLYHEYNKVGLKITNENTTYLLPT